MCLCPQASPQAWPTRRNQRLNARGTNQKSPLKFQSLSEIISFCKNDDSIFKIKENNIIPKEFFFKEISFNEIKKIIKSLNRKKSAIVLASVLIDSMDVYLPLLTDIINDSLKGGIFPDELKLAEVIPLFKKAGPFDKTNYRPVSLLSHISKVLKNKLQPN